MHSSNNDVFSAIALLVLGTVFVLMQPVETALTEQQMQQTADGLRSMCQSKFKVDDDIVDGIKAGQFPDVPDLMCYVNCVLEMMQISRRGAINYDGAMRMIHTMLPEQLRDSWSAGLTACRAAGAAETKDRCRASYLVLQCFQANNPTFIFP